MSRPVAIVTGTSSGIGKAIAERLLSHDWIVCGVSRRAAPIDLPRYHHYTADLSDSKQVADIVERVRDEHPTISLLINNAGVGHFAPHEELSMQQIQELVSLNLLAPLLLTKLLLRTLKENHGYLINIGSFSALESRSFGAAYAATKAGLLHFGDSLFQECRKSGLRVTTISPDITRTPFYDNLSFAPEEDEVAAVTPQCIADAVMTLLTQRPGTVTTHLTLRPQRLLLKKRPRAC
jgi:short-subunit dehydrogenase